MKYCDNILTHVKKVSPPARGAWIEIARGGKAGPEPPVAPRTGGVD